MAESFSINNSELPLQIRHGSQLLLPSGREATNRLFLLVEVIRRAAVAHPNLAEIISPLFLAESGLLSPKDQYFFPELRCLVWES